MQRKCKGAKMKKLAFILMFSLVGALILSACMPQPGSGGSTTSGSGSGVTSTPGSTEPPSGTPQSITVTLDDQGKTINLRVGDSFLLKLGEGYDWNITISDQSIVSRAMGIAVIRGAQGVYDAHKAGTVTLSATGDPQCLQSQPSCGLPSISFEVTIVVS
jgi:hypothetical protein